MCAFLTSDEARRIILNIHISRKDLDLLIVFQSGEEERNWGNYPLTLQEKNSYFLEMVTMLFLLLYKASYTKKMFLFQGIFVLLFQLQCLCDKQRNNII